MNYQHSFVMIKPGIRERKILGEIISRFERKGFDILALKMMHIPEALARSHYHEHVEKAFFPSLLSYICSGTVITMVIGGKAAIARIRMLCGATKVEDALPGTIRGDYALETTENIVHASDSPASAEREISLFFQKEELFSPSTSQE